MKEIDVMNVVRLEASQAGCVLFRNNVGATYTQDGSFIRYGLANDSKKMNDKIKSADLIGIRPVIIEPWMVGGIIGQFISRECKHSTWQWQGTPREIAQKEWAKLINRLGGDAQIITSVGSF